MPARPLHRVHCPQGVKMNTKPEAPMPALIGQTKLLAFVRTMIGASQGRQDDEHPLPPGPWDPWCGWRWSRSRPSVIARSTCGPVRLSTARSLNLGRHSSPTSLRIIPRPWMPSAAVTASATRWPSIRSGAQPGTAGRAPNGRGLGRSQPLDILGLSVRLWRLGHGVIHAQAASRWPASTILAARQLAASFLRRTLSLTSARQAVHGRRPFKRGYGRADGCCSHRRPPNTAGR